MASAAGTCEIARLPEDLLSAALALTTPRDACRAAAVSRAFHDAAGSDAMWARFVPRDLPPIADSGPAPPSNKERFLRLSGRRYPVLLADGVRIRPVPPQKSSTRLLLQEHVVGQGERLQVLHAATEGPAHFVGRLGQLALDESPRLQTPVGSSGLDYPPQKASVHTVAGKKIIRKVCLQRYVNCQVTVPLTREYNKSYRLGHGRNPVLPQERADGWMELEMGVFYNKKGDDGEVRFCLPETSPTLKRGLILQGIEIRPKKLG